LEAETIDIANDKSFLFLDGNLTGDINITHRAPLKILAG